MNQPNRIEFDWDARRCTMFYGASVVVCDIDPDMWALVRQCVGDEAVLMPDSRSSLQRFCLPDDVDAWLAELA